MTGCPPAGSVWRGFTNDNPIEANYVLPMSLNEVLAELPKWTMPQRQLLVRRALELDDPGLALEDEGIVERRLAAHRQEPQSALPLDMMEKRLRSRFAR